MNNTPRQLAQMIESSNRMWRLPRYHCIGYSEHSFYGRSHYGSDESLERDIAAYRKVGWAVMIWQQVWHRDEEQRVEVLVFQSEPIHPLRIQQVARHFAKFFYRPPLLGWQLLGSYGNEDWWLYL
jgi:hypothetical protein